MLTNKQTNRRDENITSLNQPQIISRAVVEELVQLSAVYCTNNDFYLQLPVPGDSPISTWRAWPATCLGAILDDL